MSSDYDSLIKKHYREQAEKHGASAASTMEDIVVREKEIEFLENFIRIVALRNRGKSLRILDLGCGNGYALDRVTKAFPGVEFTGLDFSEELLSIAKGRHLANCTLMVGDVRSLPFDPGVFDVVYTERCLVNILDWQGQRESVRQIARVVKERGYYLMIEAFTDGLENNNRAREQLGLERIKQPYHNKYFEKELLFEAIEGIFEVVDPEALDPGGPFTFCTNFLSSHYFMARVIHPLVTKGEWVRNTEFVKFFAFLPPYGNYSPIQAYVLQKK